MYVRNKLLTLWLVCLLVSGLTHAQSVREPTQLLLKIEAAAQSNLDSTGRPSPIKIHIYELKNLSMFSEADRQSLIANDRAVLGDDVLRREEFILKPQEGKSIRREAHPDAIAVGVLAGYQDRSAIWRAFYPLPEAPKAAWYRMVIPANKVSLNIQLQHHGIEIVPAP